MIYYIVSAGIAFILSALISMKVISQKNNKNQEVLSMQTYILGTVIQLRATGKKSKVAIDKAIKRLYEIDDKMSVFKNNSDISKINKSAGIRPEKVSEDTYYVIKKAIQYAHLSQGAFEPTIRPLVKLYNFGNEGTRIPSKEEINKALKLVNYKDVIINDENKSIMLRNKDQSLDLGAIAKGYAADEVKRIFEGYGIKSAIIDLGGNIYALGKKADNTSWNIGIQNPLGSTGQYLGVLGVSNKSVVTSGNYERYFEEDGKRYHHIINPKTGYPCENGIISTTIISDYSIDGDGLTTCGYVMGLKYGFKLIENTRGVDAIFITSDRKVYVTSGIRDKFTLTNKEYLLQEYSLEEYYEKEVV